MSTSNYPASADNSSTLPNPTTGSATNSPSHAALHTTENDAIKALEAKLGTGATTPAANNVLLGTGTGTTAWGQLSSSQWASVLTDETGSGSAVFGTTPTLITPKVDTINENTTDNGVTIDGLNLKDGVLNTANSVAASNIQAGAVGATALSTTAISLGSIAITANKTTTSTTFAAISGLSVQVTVPSGGRQLEIMIAGRDFFVSATTGQLAIFRGASSGALTTQVQSVLINSGTSIALCIGFDTPAAGTYFYTAAFLTGNASDTLTLEAGAGYPCTLIVKAI